MLGSSDFCNPSRCGFISILPFFRFDRNKDYADNINCRLICRIIDIFDIFFNSYGIQYR